MTLSIITPSLNQGAFIERTILSVLDQEFADLDFLVVDGGSQDATLGILATYDGRLRWISEADRGQADAVNKGLAQTTGEIIGWLNSDDVYFPGTLELVVQTFQNHPEIDVVYGNAFHIDESDQVIEPYPIEDWDPDRLLETCFICQPATFFRRSMVEKSGPLNPDLHFCLDYEYWLRLARDGARFLRTQQTLAGSRMYPENKTLSGRVRFHKEINSMFRESLGRVPDSWIFNYAHAVVDPYCSRDRKLSFPVLVTLASWASALRWNRGISKGIRRETGSWLLGNLKARWKGLRGVR